MTKSFQFLVIASRRRSTERGFIKKTYLEYVFDYRIFIQKVYMPDINDKLFTHLLEMEIFHKWSIKYYLIQTLFYRLFICITDNLVYSVQDIFSYFYRVNQWNLRLVSIRKYILNHWFPLRFFLNCLKSVFEDWRFNLCSITFPSKYHQCYAIITKILLSEIVFLKSPYSWQKLNGKVEIKSYCNLSCILNTDSSFYPFLYLLEYSTCLTLVNLLFTSTWYSESRKPAMWFWQAVSNFIKQNVLIWMLPFLCQNYQDFCGYRFKICM